MDEKYCTVNLEGKSVRIKKGTAFKEIVRSVAQDPENPIVLVVADGELKELHKTAVNDMDVRCVRFCDEDGYNTYARSMNLLLLKSVYDAGGRSVKRVVLHFSISNGYFYTVDGSVTPDARFLAKVEARMHELADANLPIRKSSVPTSRARGIFRSYRMTDKDELLRYRRNSRVNLYSLDGFEDYFYGFMVPETGILQYFSLTPYEDGFVLTIPKKNNPGSVEPFQPSPKMFQVRRNAERWGEKLSIDTVGRLNHAICHDGISRIMLVQEALQEGEISDIAEEISRKSRIKFVLIAGPSSSGKTTFSRRLSIQLLAHGMTPHPISLDNFYREREEIPRDASGDFDFECLEALDLDLFQEDMRKLLSGERVMLPRYNFTTGSKEFKNDFMQLGDKDILVLEGIHGLNKKMTEGIPEEFKYKIYISALTQLNIDEHNRIPTTDGRLIRRIVRDYRTRATSAQETIAMWDSVRRGEEQYIFPNQEEADVIFNSALIYEMAALKSYAEPLLFQVPENSPEHMEAKRLLKFLDYFLGLPTEEIPKNSILREFIGGSCFDV